jgi:DNA polymerase-4
MHILDSFSPWVEIFSIDEAFLALGHNEKFQIPNNKFQIKSKSQIPKNPPTHGLSISEIENYLELGAWNLEFQEAIKTSLAIKQRIRKEFGELITVSIGIAWGKVFAKLAGELQKPDGLVVLDKETWLERVGELSVGEICGIGYHLEEHLQTMGIKTIRDLSRADASQFVARFGPAAGIRLWQIGQGIDNAPVNPSSNLAPAKSIGHQITLDRDQPWRETFPIFTKLTQKVGRRLRRAGLLAGRVSLHASLVDDGWGDNLRHRPEIGSDGALLASIRLLWQRAPIHPLRRVVRLGVVAGELGSPGQSILPLFPEVERDEAITKALDAVRDHYGEGSIEWGSGFGRELGNLRDWRGPRAVLDQ